MRNLSRVAFALGLPVSDLYLSDSDAVGTLVDLRVKAGLTQRQLAAELGVTQDGFNHLLKYVEENGHARVPAGLKDADG